jgi:peptidoglycan/LPS O-acetylase OafA/YrhL
MILRFFSYLSSSHCCTVYILFVGNGKAVFCPFLVKGPYSFSGINLGLGGYLKSFLVESLTFSGPPTWNVPSWSISCEAVAYVVFAGAAIAGLVNRRHFAHCAIIAAAILYTIVLRYKGSLFALLDFGLLRGLAGFCVGAAVSKIPETTLASLPSRIYGGTTVLLAAVTIAALLLSDGRSDILLVPIFASLILLLQVDRGPIADMLKSRPVAFLGKTSYSIYMVHWLPLVLSTAALKYVVGNNAVYEVEYLAMYRVNPLWGDLGVVVLLILVVAIASITYRTVEVPWRSFGRAMALRAEAKLINWGKASA